MLPGSQKYFREYLSENKNILDIALGPRYCRFMQKTRVQKSDATVPLSQFNQPTFLHEKKYEIRSTTFFLYKQEIMQNCILCT